MPPAPQQPVILRLLGSVVGMNGYGSTGGQKQLGMELPLYDYLVSNVLQHPVLHLFFRNCTCCSGTSLVLQVLHLFFRWQLILLMVLLGSRCSWRQRCSPFAAHRRGAAQAGRAGTSGERLEQHELAEQSRNRRRARRVARAGGERFE